MADAGDPPARVARLNYLNGPVSFRPGGVEEWADATLNYPLTTGDHLWADSGASTEMHVGSTAIRMASQTALAFLNLDDNTVQLSLTEGSLHVRIRYLAEGEVYEVDTPNAAVALLGPGEYRIDTDSDRNTTDVVVRSGDASVTAVTGAFPVHAGESARLTGVDPVSEEMMPMPAPDQFEHWCEMRDSREDRSESARYVGAGMTGYEDLDQYGGWSQTPDYGWVWAPRAVPMGWAPYRFGHWVWVDPWGWTWIDDTPWGFAPFHYGRWAFAGARWVWVPGGVVARPVYAPALVVFVGGPRFGVSAGVAAWFPLGPHEVYRPAYHVTDVYVRRVNVTQVNVTEINVARARYVNRGVPGAVVAVNTETFVNARPVGRGVIAVNERDLRDAQIAGTAAPFAPRRESLMAGAVRGGPPARFTGREVVARTAPPPPPVPFAARQRALEANQGRPLDPAAMDRLRQNAQPRPAMVRQIQPGREVRPFDGRQAAPAAQANPQPEGIRRGEIPRDDRPVRVEQQPMRPAAQPGEFRPPRGQQPSPQPQPAQPAAQPWNRGGRVQQQSQPENRPARVQEQKAQPVQREQPRAAEPRTEPRNNREAAPARREGNKSDKRDERKQDR
jgi:hypothetical protein